MSPQKRKRILIRTVAQRKPEEKAAIELQIQDLRREIQKGIDSAERGNVCTEEEACARLRAHRQRFVERQDK